MSLEANLNQDFVDLLDALAAAKVEYARRASTDEPLDLETPAPRGYPRHDRLAYISCGSPPCQHQEM